VLDQPFWLDPTDPHRMAAMMQVVAADGIRPKQAVDEAIARIKQVLSE
jgi:hypothetical protein